MHVQDSGINNQSNSYIKSSNINSATNKSLLNKNTRDNDGNSETVMSNLSSYSLIDDDHIDDQETINVGNLIIDLESDLEKEKIENEQQANAKPITCNTKTSAPSASSTSFPNKPSSSTTASTTTITNNNLTNSIGKLSQKSAGKQSSAAANNATSNNNNSNNSVTNNNINNGHVMSTRTVFKSSSDERGGELKMRITRETKPGKSEHKIVTSPNQKSPTSSSGNLTAGSSTTTNTIGYVNNNCEDTNLNEQIPKESSSISSTKECGTSTSIGTITEPDCLGPCEPGTSVTLEGIVWQETEGGILVVNVTWRGKTYVGALLDCTKHDWAPPRLCDSPTSDIDSKTHKGVRTKRIVTRSNGVGLDEKNLLQTTGKLRNGKGRRILTSNDLAPCNKRQRDSDKSTDNLAEANASIPNASSIINSETASVPVPIDTTPATNNESISTSNISTDKAGPNSPMLIGCSEPNCSKKYRNMNGLLYHQAHAHGTDQDPATVQQDNSCSSSIKDNIKMPSKNEQVDEKDISKEDSDRHSPPLSESKQIPNVKVHDLDHEKRRTPSPQLTLKMSNKVASDLLPNNNSSALLNQESRSKIMKTMDPDRKGPTNSNHGIHNVDHGHRSPLGNLRHSSSDYGHGSSMNHSVSKSLSSSSKQSNTVPLPATVEEGMKPSGTSTGPPPAPHQANCYFNPTFLAQYSNPYGIPPSPYFDRPPLPLYNSLAIPTSNAGANFLSRFMNTVRPTPPESPSRLLSPSVPKNLPFPPFKVDQGMLPVPASQMANPPPLPNLSSLTNSPLASGSPHLRMPSQGDPMLPPNSQSPFPPPGLNPVLGLSNPMNPMGLGPVGGPQVPSLVDDPLAKQFPRRFV